MVTTGPDRIYAKIVPVTAERHAQHSVDMGKDFRFAARLGAVPILVEEFPAIARIYPIVFAAAEGVPMPRALLSLKPDFNAFIGPNNGWAAPYIPAFLRRYPFIAQAPGGNGAKELAIDAEFDGLNVSGRGYRMFEDDGSMTKFLRDVSDFTMNFESGLAATRRFVRRLAANALFEPLTFRVADASGTPASALTGLLAVSERRLARLDPAALAALKKAGDLGRCGLHLKSLTHVTGSGRS